MAAVALCATAPNFAAPRTWNPSEPRTPNLEPRRTVQNLAEPGRTLQRPVETREPIEVRLREEGLDHSEVMRTLHFLTDVYGPRLTGSPSLKAAGEWSVKTMESCAD